MSAVELPRSSLRISRSAMPLLNPIRYGEGPTEQTTKRPFSWDLAAASQPLLTSFHYISSKLACHGLHVAFIVKNSRPELVSAWPIGIQTQHLLAKFIQKANEQYRIDYTWLKALLELCKPIEANYIFESHRAISYIVHRSLAQKDLIYSGEGLTVLAVDCIYSFKGQLTELGGEMAVPLFREDCKESCVELLRYVNTMYKDIILSRGYLRRAYHQFELDEDVLEEVCEAYRARFGSEGIFDAPIAVADHCESTTAKSSPHQYVEQLQASPRKLPQSKNGNSRHKAGQLARASLKGPESIHRANRTFPSREPSTPTETFSHDLQRPKSPKGSLFESPRSPPVTPPRSARLRTMSKSANLRADSSLSQDSNTLVDQAESPPSARFTVKKRGFIGPILGLYKLEPPESMAEESTQSRGKSLDLRRNGSLSRSRSLKPSPEISSRASSTNRSIKTTISRRNFANAIAKLKSGRSVSQPESQFDWDFSKPSKPTSLRGFESKFGWLQVSRRKEQGTINAGAFAS